MAGRAIVVASTLLGLGSLAGCSAADAVAVTQTTGATIGLGSTSATASGASAASTTGTAASTGTTGGTSGGMGTTTGGAACPGGAQPCTDAGLCCPGGTTCAQGICCEQPCNGTCCDSEQTCATITGITQCLRTCAESSRCPENAPCCSPTEDGHGVCINGDPSNGVCICETAADCDAGGATSCCAPALNPAGEPTGPYVCKPNDGSSYDCCYGWFVSCGGGDCCVQDGVGNEFCALPCTQPSDCPATQCQNYNFSPFITTCPGTTACGPN